MFPKNPWTLLLFGVLLATTAYYGVVALIQLQRHRSLDSRTPVEEISWTIDQRSSNRYWLVADYRYSVGDVGYSGSATDHRHQLNRWTAQRRQQELQGKPWQIWYASKTPKESALFRSFPLKECATALVLLVLLVYFVILGS